MAFQLTVEVERSPQEVFTFLADSTNTPAWYEAVRFAEQLGRGPVGEGTRYRFVRELPVGRVENLVEVTEFHAGDAIELSSIEGPTPFTYHYKVIPTSRGASVVLDGEISGEGLSGPLAILAPLASQFFARGMERNLYALKRHLESEPHAT